MSHLQIDTAVRHLLCDHLLLPVPSVYCHLVDNLKSASLHLLCHTNYKNTLKFEPELNELQCQFSLLQSSIQETAVIIVLGDMKGSVKIVVLKNTCSTFCSKI